MMKRRKFYDSTSSITFKVPYLGFTVEEEFMLHELVEGRNLVLNLAMEEAIESKPDLVTRMYHGVLPNMAFDSELTVRDIVSWDDCNKKIVSQCGNALVPSSLGKPSNGLISMLFQSSYKALNMLEGFLFFCNSEAKCLYDQEINGGFFDFNHNIKSWLRRHIPTLESSPAVQFTDCPIFSSLFTRSSSSSGKTINKVNTVKQDETFFRNTIDLVRQVVSRDMKVVALISLLTTIYQKQDSLWYSSKSVQFLYKSVLTLLHRYLSSGNADLDVESRVAQVTSLLPKLHRCASIFDERIK